MWCYYGKVSLVGPKPNNIIIFKIIKLYMGIIKYIWIFLLFSLYPIGHDIAWHILICVQNILKTLDQFVNFKPN